MARAAAAVLVLVVACLTTSVAWDPDGGLVKPLAMDVRTVSVSSNAAAAKGVIDGNDQTHWQSGACFPTGFIARSEMNALLNISLITPSAVVTSAGSSNIPNAFDNSFYTGAGIKAAGGVASIVITLPQGPKDLFRFYFRGAWGKGVAKLVAVAADGSTTVISGDLNSTTNYKDFVVRGLWPAVTQLQLVSNDSFTLIELAAQYARCYEMATVDMGSVQTAHLVRVRWWSGNDATNTTLLTSADGVSWNVLAEVNPAALATADFWLDSPQQIRFIAVKHLMVEEDWKKCYVWDVAAYGEGGRWGPAPAPVMQAATFRQLLGLNGIWGWGSQMFSDSAAAKGQGPVLYSSVASSGRNYENMNWDVKKPGDDPKYDTMNKTGTGGQWWLNWDREYFAWKRAGLPVAASFQFTARDQPATSWGANPQQISYDLGFKFARHFGKTWGTGSVESFEAGNEPWDYNATFYSTLLRGFLDGLNDGDATGLKRLPCALQAHDPTAESASSGNYIGKRVPESHIAKIDALNTHTYSFFTLPNSTRIAVHPEHPGSSLHGVHNMLRWRDTNMPAGTPLWVTEWGWDAHRPDEPCNSATTECVSQLAQASYGIRGLAMLARKGVAQTHWFFYANDDACNTLFCRSGLRDTKTAGFVELPVYRAFAAFMQAAGSSYFSRVIQEDKAAWVYVFSNAAGVPSHVLAWRPVPVGAIEDPVTDRATVQFDAGFAAAATSAVWLSGAAPGGAVPAELPAIGGSSWTMVLSGIPTLVTLQQQP